MLVFGTRPEVIKLAPLAHTLRRDTAAVELTLCATGQHREMLASALEAFELAADVDLELMTPGQHPTELLARLLTGLRAQIRTRQPDVIVVQGDTTTVMAASLAGFLDQVTVAHVEAGLRTRDRRAPFPEEINRRVAGVVADLHFAATPGARDNLLGEGVDPASVFVTGNTGIDALHWMRARTGSEDLPPDVAAHRGRVVLVTAHRRESFGAPFREVCAALRALADRFADVRMVYPVHLNPNVQKPVRELLGDHPRIDLLDPQPYDRFVALIDRADLILTDSGGIQEEAPSLGKPTLVLRDKTERPEAVAAGVVRLVGTRRDAIVTEAGRLLADPAAYAEMARVVAVYGDGLASARIAEVLIGGAMRQRAFAPLIRPPA